MGWVPLHVHSQYSILDASAPIDEIAKKAKQMQMPAVALTDHGNLFGAVDFFKACKGQGIKPIIGCELYVAPHSRFDKKKVIGERTSFHLTLLAKNQAGYHNLCKLSSIGYIEGFYYNPRIDLECLKAHSEGLICLSGCLSSHLSQMALNHTYEELKETALFYQHLFGEDYYLELQRHQMKEEDLIADGIHEEAWLLQKYRDLCTKQTKVNALLLQLSDELKIKPVATNDSHYMERSDWKAHEILLNVQSGEPCEIWEKDAFGNRQFRNPNPKRNTYPSHEYYFKSQEEMGAIFSDVKEALENTLEIADKCHMELDFKTKHYPVYLPPSLKGKEYSKEEQSKAAEDYLWKLCQEGISKRYTPEKLAKVQEKYPDKEPLEIVRERLNFEMGVIVPKGMCDYLLIVWDFINWAKRNQIPVGPGRGSGAGSIVLYLIGITDIEPIRFDLFFERFINPERISYPDIDVDICMDRRNEVINYTVDHYGKESVCQIITFGTMKAKMTIKDVGRVLDIPLSKVNEIAKLVPEDPNMTLAKALDVDKDLATMAQEDEDAMRILELGRKLEGSIRSTGLHAAGVIISGDPLTDHIPVCIAKDSDMPVSQFSMKPVELVGMLKIDFLGLKTLTSIQLCVDAIKKRFNQSIDWVNLPLDDSATFSLLNQGKTLGIFQIESAGMQELARNLHLDRFEEIIAVLALYRPGPMDMIPSFINRKHGKEAIDYDHPWIEEILKETYGIMVYQEQVMQIAQKLASYSLGEGDVLRRAMGKKDASEMASQRLKFVQGAQGNGLSEELATQIFDKMEKFAAYGFNKSHAAAYAYLTYVTAYFKANYPSEWMAALMTCDRDDVTKVAKLIGECQAMNIPILQPDVNEASDEFSATTQGIRFAISAIKGVGTNVVLAILDERHKNGPFKGLYDFIKRIDTKKVGKKAIENLVDAGCFDFTGWSRDALRESIEPFYDTAVKEQKEASAGFLSLFSLIEEEKDKEPAPPAIARPSTKLQLLLKEKQLLGFFITGHPLHAYTQVLERLSCVPLSKIADFQGETILRLAFILEEVQVRIASRSQKKFAILTVSDGYERLEAVAWPDIYEEKKHLLLENQLLYAVVQVEKKEENLKITLRWVDDLTRADEPMIHACDQAYDRAKFQLSRALFFQMPKKGKDTMTPKPATPIASKEKATSCLILIDADKLQLSHLLKIKEILSDKRGTTPVEMRFTSQQGELASLLTGPAYFIGDTATVCNQLKNIPSIVSSSVQ